MLNIPPQNTSSNGLQVVDLHTHQHGPYSLCIAAGECISLRGPSGSGKSLLLRAIADLDPHQGRVLLNGTDCQSMQAPLWRKQVALVSAESQWWFDEVGAHFTDDHCKWFEPLGFAAETMRWQVSRLSSGEKQRLSLARALMNQPRVLLLDEPTASLDVSNVQVVEKLVADYRCDTGASVLWVSHDVQQAARVGDQHFKLNAKGQLNTEAQLSIQGIEEIV